MDVGQLASMHDRGVNSYHGVNHSTDEYNTDCQTGLGCPNSIAARFSS